MTALRIDESVDRVSPKSVGRLFFSATCYPTVTRRQLLLGGGAFLVTGPRRAFANTPEDGAAMIRQHATPLDDPWLVAHGLRAMGRGFTLGGSQRAVDYLLETVLASVPANGKTVLGFPPEVEGHSNMFLKTMLEAGVPLDHAFTHNKGHRRTLQDVVEGARALIRPTLIASSPNALPWSLIALTRTTAPSRSKWTNAWGESVDLDALVESALRLLEEASLPVAEVMREGRPETRQAPVHGFTCGGGHMIYALLAALHGGYTGSDRPRRMQQQMDLLVWRLGADLDLIDRFYKTRAGSAGVEWYALNAKLKLLGHGVECLAFATAHDVVGFTPSQREQRQVAVTTLRRMLRDLGSRDLGEVKALNREVYRQVVGDTCHARHGLTLA